MRGVNALSRAFVSAHNMAYDPHAYLQALPADVVDELHLGGFTPEPDEAAPSGTLLVDTHATAIAEDVWRLHGEALARFGPAPTLIEWDNDLPTLNTQIHGRSPARGRRRRPGAGAPDVGG